MSFAPYETEILLLGVGNLLYGDEGVGVHAVRHLEAEYELSSNVRLVDGGTAGQYLMPTLSEAKRVIVMDTVRGGQEPGTIYRLENEDLRKSIGFWDTQHEVSLEDILVQCELIGNKPEVVIIGIEPLDMKTLQMELTPLVQEKMPKFISHVLDELRAQGGDAWLRGTRG